jgi:hypothetical protein
MLQKTFPAANEGCLLPVALYSLLVTRPCLFLNYEGTSWAAAIDGELQCLAGNNVQQGMTGLQQLLQCLRVRRVSSLRRCLILLVALVIVMLLSRLMNVHQRVCDVRDWEFASSMFVPPKIVSRGPLLLHGSNGSCTIVWESFSPTSLHFSHPMKHATSQFSASRVWLPHYIGLLQVPFGCAWNVSRTLLI